MKDKITQLGHDHDAIKRKLEQIERLLQEKDACYEYAKELAVNICQKYYKDDASVFEPLDDLMGVLTQIDNMTCDIQFEDLEG